MLSEILSSFLNNFKLLDGVTMSVGLFPGFCVKYVCTNVKGRFMPKEMVTYTSWRTCVDAIRTANFKIGSCTKTHFLPKVVWQSTPSKL